MKAKSLCPFLRLFAIAGLALAGITVRAEFTVSVEKESPFPLWLPAPGPSTEVPPLLSEQVRDAQAELVGRAEALAQAREASPFATQVLITLAGTTEYAQIDVLYENRLRDQGPAWAETAEAEAILPVRQLFQEAALSATVEPDEQGHRRVLFIRAGEKAALGLDPSLIDSGDPATLKDAAAILCRFVVEGVVENPAYQALASKIAANEKRRWPAREASQRGLDAAGRNDWPAAVAAFTEALESAHATPSLMFNLALAYQRRGWAIPAAKWYRAYLAAVPDAPNAEAVRAETEKLIAAAKADALRLLDEAEKLADALPATSPASGGKSLRQASLERIGSYASMAGMTERAAALLRKIESLPRAAKIGKFSDKHGLYAAYLSLDANRTQQILAQWGDEYRKDSAIHGVNAQLYVYAFRGDTAEVRRLIGGSSDNDLRINFSFARDYDATEVIHARKMATPSEFDAGWFAETLVPDIEKAFYDGRPDVALRLARLALAYAGKKDDASSYLERTFGLIPSALLGDQGAVKAGIQRRRQTYYGPLGDDLETNDGQRLKDGWRAPLARIALASAAVLPSREAVSFIDYLMSETERDGPAKETWPILLPLTYFALCAAADEPDKALAVLDRLNEIADGWVAQDAKITAEYRNKYKVCLQFALRFAVATGRTDLAFSAADRLPKESELKLVALNRLALAPGADASVQERVDEYAVTVGGGWRPRDAAQAKEVLVRLRLARRYRDDDSFASLAEVLEKAAKTASEKPETLPADLAGYAVIRWIEALAARAEL